MNTTKKINWYIGLTTKEGAILKQDLTEQRVNRLLELTFINCYSTAIQTGYWEGKQEQTLVVTVIDTTNLGENLIERIASLFASEFNQDCVLVTSEEIKYNFVG